MGENMRKSFEKSHETDRLVAFFCKLSLSQLTSFDDTSKAVGFAVFPTLPAYQSARKIAERDHGVYVATVRGVGFVRGTHSDMKNSGYDIQNRVRKASKRGASRMLLALKGNLNEVEHREATELYSRFNIISSTASQQRASSNRARNEPVPMAPPVDTFAKIASLGRKKS